MTAFLDFTIQSNEFTLGEILDVEAATQVELTQLVPVGESLAPYFWADTDDDDAVASEVLASPHVETVSKLDGATGRSLFHVRWKTHVDELFDTLQAHDLAVLRGVGSEGCWKFRLVAENRATFSEFQSACQEKGIRLTVNRLSNSAADNNPIYGVTAKQREALLHAYKSGYYDVNKPVQLGKLSNGLNISQQAFGSRLKRGTGNLIRNTIVVDG
ncbi:helix-turn-helix domain-containing protein [Halogeometricum sp. S1BR25-6]|uniref:Helix-turn-helix domain-containing protein n=1 Tax=Halogeometricum salsisoli TaxID=2950536 RepID=A0ABU2GH98_9EURY|nr:helix-turn-helix domain-containing protein [Halogeometricum sp. S1BR25-6]MDS0300195.1 helix-turn-helix domain-containing protein [Halogeometricum sp. S1BR25-6]